MRTFSKRKQSNHQGKPMLPSVGHAEFRATWRTNWLSSIQELADLDMQRATWLNPHGKNPHFSFVEYVTCYFDDLRFGEEEGGYAARIADNLLSQEEAAAVSEFHTLFNNYKSPTHDYDHCAILQDPEWLRVVAAARAAQALLAIMIDRLEERESLLEASVHALATAARYTSDVR
jgi:hypothetical protein